VIRSFGGLFVHGRVPMAGTHGGCRTRHTNHYPFSMVGVPTDHPDHPNHPPRFKTTPVAATGYEGNH
jgi:hypothetical protein